MSAITLKHSTKRITLRHVGVAGTSSGSGSSGLPTGGTDGQVLVKTGSVNGEADWETLTKSSVGLGNVDNTSDAAKPVSTATLTALNAKANSTITITGTSSVTGGGDLSQNRTLSLVNDSSTPGNSTYYGTDATGVKGFFSLPNVNESLKVFNVKDAEYGAIGNGIADDYAAIQAAIDDAAVAGGIVFLPIGTYNVKTPLIPKTYVRLTGVSYGKSVIKVDGNNMFDCGTAFHELVKIDNLGLEATNGHVFYRARFTRWIFENLRVVQNSANYSVWSATLTQGSSLMNWLTWTDSIINVYGATRTVPAFDITSSGIDLVTELVFDRLIWWNRDYDDTQYAIRIICTGSSSNKNLTFRNNVFEQQMGGSLRIEGADGVFIENCHTWDMPAGDMLQDAFSIGKNASGNPSSNVCVVRSGRDGDGPATGVQDISVDSTTTQVTIDSPAAASTGVNLRIDLDDAQGATMINLPDNVTTSGTSNAAYVQTQKGTLKAQPVSGENALDIINKDGTGSASALKMAGASGSRLFSSQMIGDAVNRFVGDYDGKLAWGNGTNSRDVTLHRPSAGKLLVTGDLEVSGYLNGKFKDTELILRDESDLTKQVQFQLSGITTLTTRTISFPDASGTTLLRGDTATVTNKTISGASNTITNIAQSSVTNLVSTLNNKINKGDAVAMAVALG